MVLNQASDRPGLPVPHRNPVNRHNGHHLLARTAQKRFLGSQ